MRTFAQEIKLKIDNEIIDGRYQILQKLGEGGMGEVYKVRDLDSGREIVLKMLLPEITEGEDFLHFKREFYNMTKVRHPNIVEVYDYGITPEERAYFTMEYLEGKNIVDFFKFEENFKYLTSTVAQICSALSFIHSRGLIHYDLKPSNIMILQKGKAKLLDFGLAEPIDLSVPKTIRGTLSYMAPEMAKGVKVDQRVDLYSLGVLLYEVVTGKVPFQGKNPVSVIKKHLEKKPHLPQSKKLPQNLRGIILKLMEKDPERRFQSANEVIDSLDSSVRCKLFKQGQLFPPKFIGRKEEVKTLLRLLDAPKFILVSGESGIGKSRLMQEFKFEVQLRGGLFITGKCLSDGRIPYNPFAEILRQLVWSVESNDKRVIAKYGSELVKLVPKLKGKDYLKENLQSPPLRSDQEKLRMFNAVIEFIDKSSHLLTRSADKPMVLLIEDLQWVDPQSLELLGYLIRSKALKNVSICGTFRDEEVTSSLRLKQAGFGSSPHPLLTFIDQLKQGNRLIQIGLKRLNFEATASLIGSMLGSSPIDHRLALDIFELTQGNPLFTSEMVRALAEEGGLHHQDGGWRVDYRKLKGLKIPKKVKGLLGERLGKLSREALRILSIAAVIGKEFRLDVLKKVGECDDEDLFSMIEEGIGAGVIKESRIRGRLKYDFTHPLIREVLYREIRPLVKRTLHQRAARALERTYEGRIDEVVDQLAYHFSRGIDQVKAIAYLEKSAHQAKNQYSNAKSIANYKLALKLMEKKGLNRDKIRILEALGDVYDLVGEYQKAIRTYRKALSLLASTGPSAGKLATLYRKIGNVLEKRGKHEEALKSFQAGLHQLGETENPIEKAKLYDKIGWTLYRKGEYESAIEYCKRGLRIAERENAAGEIPQVYNILGVIHWNKGDFQTAKIYYQRSLELLERIGDTYGVAKLYNNLGLLYKDEDNWKEALKCYQKSLDIKKRVGDIKGLAYAYSNLSIIYKDKGQWDRAENYYKSSLKILEKIGELSAVATLLNNLGLIHRRRGDWDKAMDYLKRSLKLNRELKNSQGIALCYENIGELYISQGNWGKALAYLRKGLTTFRSLGVKSEQATVYRLLGEVYLRKAMAQKALESCNRSLEISKKLRNRLEEGNAHRVLGSLYGFIGENSKAKGSFANSIMILKKLGADYDLGRTFLDLGCWMHQKGIEGMNIGSVIKGPLQFLTEAKEIFKKLGAKKEMKRADEFIHKEEKRRLGLPEGEDRLLALYRISQIINSIRDIDELLTNLMDLVNVELKAQRGLIFLLDEGTNRLDLRVARNVDRETVEDATKISRKVVREVLRGGQPIISSDAANDSRFKDNKSVILNGIKSLLCVPLKIKEKVIGTIYVDSCISSNIFSAQDLKFLTSLANQAAIAIENARLHHRLRKECEYLREEVRTKYHYENIIGNSVKMQKVYETLEKVIRSSATVLIYGESGTGKELIARAIHYNGERRTKKFVAQNCSALPEQLLESELFGHVKGAFTGAVKDKKGLFEIADGGTFFLDEISEMSPNLQAKLLRVLEDGQIRKVGGVEARRVDVRIIAATNKDLGQQVKEEKFREDLYYRLNVVKIDLPPLRERKEDIPLLANHFLKKYSLQNSKEITGFTEEAMELLTLYHWPGNVRELENEVERAVVLTTNQSIISAEVLSQRLKKSLKPTKIPFKGESLKRMMDDVERRLLKEALEKNNWNRTKTAKALGLSRQALIKKLSKYSLKYPLPHPQLYNPRRGRQTSLDR